MKEPELNFSPESIDELTERFVDQLPAQDSQLIDDLYRIYTPGAEENSRSIQRIWNRFSRVEEQHRLVQAHPRRSHRSLWSRLSNALSVAVALLIVLSLVLLTYAIHKGSSQTALGVSLTLDGGPQLDQNVVFLVKSSEGGQYLATLSFEMYDGHSWSNPAVSTSGLPARMRTISEGYQVHLVTQQITVVNSSGELQPYILGAGQIASVDQPTTLLIDKTTGGQLAVLGNNGQPFAAGEQFTVQSYVSSADIAMLRSIPLPADAPRLSSNSDGAPPLSYYNPAILRAYLQLPKIDPRVKDLALRLTAGEHTVFDKIVALENYFRWSFTYSNTINPPSGVEGTAWLLFQSDHSAFCNYFASALAVLARELGMPARVVIGYTSGTYDAHKQNWVVHASDAHAWTQVYFAGYGWINFEPSPSFPQFMRPL